MWKIQSSTIMVCLFLAAPGPTDARSFEGMTDDEIRASAGADLRAKAAEVTPSCLDSRSTLEAVGAVLEVRHGIFEELQKARDLTSLDDILLADSIDDSLAYHLGGPLDAYVQRNPEPIYNPGTEKFTRSITQLGFVQEWASGFLIQIELEQSLLILADYMSTRSEAEAEAAQDALLRHSHMLTQLYRAQHQELDDLHACHVANLEWVVGRLESENGTNDFYVANQMFASRISGFAYFLKLASPTTGEVMDIYYPLPHLTQMDEGWPRFQELMEKRKREAEERNRETGAEGGEVPQGS